MWARGGDCKVKAQRGRTSGSAVRAASSASISTSSIVTWQSTVRWAGSWPDKVSDLHTSLCFVHWVVPLELQVWRYAVERGGHIIEQQHKRTLSMCAGVGSKSLHIRSRLLFFQLCTLRFAHTWAMACMCAKDSERHHHRTLVDAFSSNTYTSKPFACTVTGSEGRQTRACGMAVPWRGPSRS